MLEIGCFRNVFHINELYQFISYLKKTIGMQKCAGANRTHVAVPFEPLCYIFMPLLEICTFLNIGDSLRLL